MKGTEAYHPESPSEDSRLQEQTPDGALRTVEVARPGPDCEQRHNSTPSEHKDQQVSKLSHLGDDAIYSDKYFDKIREICADSIDNIKGPSPIELTNHRKSTWPHATRLPDEMAKIYKAVRTTGVPNCIGSRIVLPSGLRLDAWERVFGSNSEHIEMLTFVKYGFPLGYMGPCSPLDDQYNHSRATKFPEHIEKFLRDEVEGGGVVGPMDAPPFESWAHCAPPPPYVQAKERIRQA